MEAPQERVDSLTDASTETWMGQSETRRNQTFTCEQSQHGALEPRAGPEDLTSGGSFWGGAEEAESELECPTLERINNTSSEMGSVQESSQTSAEDKMEEDDIITTPTTGDQTPPTPAKHPGKVIVTRVTIDSLTVTFKEATVAEGFFRGF